MNNIKKIFLDINLMFREDIHARKSGKSLQMDDEKVINRLYRTANKRILKYDLDSFPS